MAIFDPKAKPDPADRKEPRPGRLILVMKRIHERKLTKTTKKPQLRVLYEVIVGPDKGLGFFSNISLDLSSSGVVARLGMFAECVGCESAFDLDSDDAVREAFCNKPFVADVERKVDGQYTNYDIKRYVPTNKLTQGEIAAMRTWALEQAESRTDNGLDDDDDRPPRDDSDAPPVRDNGGWGSTGAAPKQQRDDDDIPF